MPGNRVGQGEVGGFMCRVHVYMIAVNLEWQVCTKQLKIPLSQLSFSASVN